MSGIPVCLHRVFYWVHNGCGGVVDSYLAYSDSENDYFFPICLHCNQRLDRKEIEAVYAEGAD